jgi:LDH2 family malate/lactate/ureidoglycolate dehydrogenase
LELFFGAQQEHLADHALARVWLHRSMERANDLAEPVAACLGQCRRAGHVGQTSSYDPGQVARQKGFVGVWMTSVRKMRSCARQGMELETTVDQALIRGLGTAFRAYVSGLSSV